MVTGVERTTARLWLQEDLYRSKELGILKPGVWTLLSSNLTLRWSKKMYRSIGVARFHPAKFEALVTLSDILWEVAKDSDRRETVSHELAHLIVYANHTYDPQGEWLPAAHGEEWREVMQNLGYENPSSHHMVFNEEHEKKRGHVPLFCCCDTSPHFWVREEKAESLVVQGAACRICGVKLIKGE